MKDDALPILDLLDCDSSKPLKESVRVSNDDPATVFTELSEYIATPRLRAEYEALFGAMASAAKFPKESAGIWISGFFGSGKSSFAKNAAYVLANRDVLGASATSVFLKQVDSPGIRECIEFLNRSASYETFAFDAGRELPAEADAKKIAELICRRVRSDLGYAEVSAIGAQDPAILSVRDFVDDLFAVVEVARPGKTFALIIDDIESYLAAGHFNDLRLVVEQFADQSAKRAATGRIPGPAWIIATAEEKPPDMLGHCFDHQIDLSLAGIVEVAAQRVLRKKENKERLLRNLFRAHGAALLGNVKLEQSSRRTEFNEDQFVWCYPYPPHLIELAIDVVAGIRSHPNSPKHIPDGSRSILKLCSDLLFSDATRFAGHPVGALVSIDKIYDLLEVSLPPEKQHDVSTISEHCYQKDHPGMAERVTKAICVMEFVKTNLPRTTNNVAALLVKDVREPAPRFAVAAVLARMREACLIRETAEGWTLHEYDFDELHRRTASLDGLQRAIGAANPRPPGWRNDLIQLAKRSIARTFSWYTQSISHFSCSVTRSLEDIVSALYPLNDLPIEMLGLRRRLARSEKKIAILQRQLEVLNDRVRTPRQGANTCERTAYVIGLFGTGRLYVCELIQQNLGERARYFRDAIRLHPGPTPMIYSGHATIRRPSRGQNPPAVVSRILDDVRAGFADLIFIYRHPLDSLLTNWIWWRTHLRDCRRISGIAQLYPNAEDLCSDLEQNFLEFKAFAAGDPQFFAHAEAGPPFLSFNQFVEETEHYLESDVTVSLRLEDFMIDPRKEFSKIIEVMSADTDLSGANLAAPKSKPYRFAAVKDNVPRFRSFIEGLSAATRTKIERIGYTV